MATKIKTPSPEQIKTPSPEQIQRVEDLCHLLLMRRKRFSHKFKAWLNDRVEARKAEGPMSDHLRGMPMPVETTRVKRMHAEIASIFDFINVPEDRLVPTVIDLYAETHGYTWDGEKNG